MTDPFNFGLNSPFNPVFEFSLFDKPENNGYFSPNPYSDFSQLPTETLPSLHQQPSTEFPFDIDMDIELNPEEILFNEQMILPSEEIRNYQEEYVIQEALANEEMFQYDEIFDEIPKKKTFKIQIEIDDALYELIQQNRQNRETQIEEEDVTSVSTKETVIGVSHNKAYCCIEGSFDGSFQEIENDWNQALMKFAEKRPTDEKNYLKRISPHVVGSIKETLGGNDKMLPNQKMFEAMLSELLYGKEIQMSRDHELLKDMMSKEMEWMQRFRPEVDLDKKERRNKKKVEKKEGKKVHSALNHMNENFVSNVFRFAKDNYPGDKELQRVACERGVSAVNFRNMTTAKMDDGILVRKAKVRLVASGKELVTNIESWMLDGYFENCEDSDKYIQYKQKAMTNLALDRMY